VKVLVAAGTAAAAVVAGSLVQLPGAAGCVSSSRLDTGCTHGRVVARPSRVVVSADGRNVYTAGGTSLLASIAVFDRSAITGRLTQKPGLAGCVVLNRQTTGCTHARALETPTGLALSPDGRNLYVTALNSGAVDTFRRNADGSLVQLAGTAACVSSLNTGGRCKLDRGVGHPGAVAVSADGRFVYVAGNTLAVLARAPLNGALTPLQDVSGLGGDGVALSPDGTSVYVAGGGGAHGHVTAYSRDPATGKVTQIGCVAQALGSGCAKGYALQQAADVVVSPDGRNVYAASEVSSGIAIFRRSPTGLLSETGCVTAGGAGVCTTGNGLLGLDQLAVSAAGFRLFAGGEAASVWKRDLATGALTELDCYSSTGVKGCHHARNTVRPVGIALSPDTRHVYTASVGRPGTGGLPVGGGVAIFRRAS